MKWVDKDEVGTEIAATPLRKLGEVGEIAEPPGLMRSHRVQLRGEAPTPTTGEALR